MASHSDDLIWDLRKRVGSIEEKVTLLIAMNARTQDMLLKLPGAKRSTLYRLRERLAKQRHYIKELEKELKLS